MPQVFQESAWIVPGLLLFVVAWTRFNSPPTNRAGTTFALFSFGVIYYYALIIALWLLVIIAVNQGLVGLEWFGTLFTKGSPEAKIEAAQFAPIAAALIIVVASQFHQVSKIDTAARSFCVKAAAIPLEADRLAVELAQNSEFQPKTDGLRTQVTQLISGNISPKALNFSMDGTLPARFTKAVALYWLFVAPRNNGTPEFITNAHSRSAYSRIMQLGDAMAARADIRYEEMMQTGFAFFASPNPTKDLKDALNATITEVSNLVCNLIARYVLYCEVTRSSRRQRLSSMGFDATHPMPSFGSDKWATTILAVIVLSVGMMAFMPGTNQIAASKILTIAIAFGISIGFAVMGAILVAQRSIERHQGKQPAYPPIAELTLAALIVAGLSVATRIAVPLVPAVIHGGTSALPDVITQFVERWPGIIVPFVCTISLGLLCSYLTPLNWSWSRVAAVGALGNGLAFMVAGLLVGWLLDDEVLAQFYRHPEDAPRIIVITTGVTGAIIGAMVLVAFKKSERARKVIAERAVDVVQASIPTRYAPAAQDLEPSAPSPSVARRALGGYTRENVEGLEGRYVCFRPAFTTAGVISAYLIVVRWEEAQSCLMFEEEGRVDAGHTQSGRVYIPDGRPFMSLVTAEKGAMRLIMVARPDGQEPARGLIMTLSNPSGTHFTPACAPIVLRRVVGETPQLGFIRPDDPDHDMYFQELDRVMPAFGLFATASKVLLGMRMVS